MEYYQIQQNEKLKGSITLNREYKEMLESAQHQDEALVLYYDSREYGQMDYITLGRHTLVSDRLMKLLKQYENEILFKLIFMINQNSRERSQYWLMEVPQLQCLSKKTEFHPDGTIKRLVIDEELIKDRAIFTIDSSARQYSRIRTLVNLAVAESILRRGIAGITYETVAVEQEEAYVSREG